jgi:carboxymethylenebutenolidase
MPESFVRRLTVIVLAGVLAACAHRTAPPDEHMGHGDEATAPISQAAAMAVTGIPPGAADAQARLTASPRHGEWAMIPAGTDSVRAWVVYPERSTKAPVVVVVHEIFGLSTWVRAVADQLAAEGFIAIAPDFLTGKLGGRNPDAMPIDTAIALIRTLKPEEVQQRIDAAARYGMSLPAALPKYGVVGFCWGGSTVFAHAVHAPTLGAAVVYYGGSPPSAELTNVRAPVLGLYGGNDARVNATIPPADSTMRALNKIFEPHIFAGAGHGFLRAQEGQNGANLTASTEAWPLTIAWFRRHLGA